MAAVRRIEDEEALRGLILELAGGPIALDTEADSLHHYRDKVCLIQVSWPGGDAVIDPLAPVDPRALARVLSDPGVLKVLHGADYDLRILRRDFDMRIRGIFDTMIAARLVGEPSFGLAVLVERYLGVRLDKAHQRADWSKRPLPDEMVEYAAADTRHLPALAEHLRERLGALGRIAWAEEEFRAVEAVRWTRDDGDGERWRRVRGASSLDRRGLAVLRAVHEWRERRAERRDVPPFRIARDAALLELSRMRPADEGALARVPGLPGPLRRGSLARDLLGAVAKGEAVPDRDLPDVERGPRRRPDPEFERRVRALRSSRDRIASGLGLDPPVLASRAALEAIQRRVDEGRSWRDVEELREWQRGELDSLVD